MSNANEPAFPKITTSYGTGTAYTDRVGLTKREYFAAMAMQGFITNSQILDECGYRDLDPQEACAQIAIKQADALIAELEKQP